MSDSIVDWIYNRVHKQNKNFMCAIIGETGSGKSYCALRIAEVLDSTFNISRVCFTPNEFMALLNSGLLRRGNFIVLDEAGVSMPARDFMSFTNKAMSYILQTFRHENLGVIFTLPDLNMMDVSARKLLHALIETQEIDAQRQEVLVKFFFINNNPRFGKIYARYPRFVSEDGAVIKYDGFYIGKPSEALIQAYEEKKKQFTAQLKRDISLELQKLEKRKNRVDSDEYFNQALADAQERWRDFISLRKTTRRMYIDKAKLKLAYPHIAGVKLPLLRRILELNLKRKQ
ncbi:MAG: hypothetical protein QXF56_00970 [Candidatus Micrarchaeia archaeon]